MGGNWKISETYATWLLNNASPGSNEILDSLMNSKTETEFRNYLTIYEKDIRENFFTRWQVDAQNMALSDRFAEAYK